MGLGRQVNHGIRPRLGEDSSHRFTVPDVGHLEAVVLGVIGLSERLDVTRVGECIEGHDEPARCHEASDHAGSDKAGSARNHYAVHHSPFFRTMLVRLAKSSLAP